MKLSKFAVAGCLCLISAGAQADDGYVFSPWSATLYAGPSTNSFFTRIIQGHVRVNGGMIGLAGDVRLFKLGDGFSFGAEGQITNYAYGHSYQTFAGGLGFRYDFNPWSVAIYSGPSYATDPPLEQYFHGHHLLNYVGVEFSYQLPQSDGWDLSWRFYHRSGAFGLYSRNADEGTAVGIGIRKQF